MLIGGCKMDRAHEAKQQRLADVALGWVDLVSSRRQRPLATRTNRVHDANEGSAERHQRTNTTTTASAKTKSLLWLLACCLSQLLAVESAMNLPDGIENILGFVPRSSFKCEHDGYFGDTDNDCRLFHLCQRQLGPGGRVEWHHWTYACGNQTMFNQLTLTCAFVDEAIPCRHASQFQYLNEVIHKPAEPFLTDADVTSGFSYYSNRVMSDGARQRAFEDSQLLAQVGGAFAGNNLAAGPSSPPKKSLVPATHPALATLASQQHRSSPFESSFTSTFNPSILQNFAPSATQSPFQDLTGPVDLATSRSFQFQTQSQPQPGGATIASAPSDRSQQAALLAAPNAASKAQENSQFEFSITTSHQANSPSEPANVIFRQQQPLPVAVGTQPPATTPTATPAATPAAVANRQQQFPSGVTQNPAFVATFTNANRLQTAQTQVTTLVTPTTSTTPVAPTLPTVASNTTKPQQTTTTTRRAVPATSSGRALRAGFQSTRLSTSNNQLQQQQQKRQTQPASIVMRKASRLATATSNEPANGRSKPLASSPLLETDFQTPAWSTGGDFWRRSFDSQLMAPKFESLLLRRRV